MLNFLHGAYWTLGAHQWIITGSSGRKGGHWRSLKVPESAGSWAYGNPSNNCVGVDFIGIWRFSSNWHRSQENTEYYSTCGFYFYCMLVGSENKLMVVLKAYKFKSIYLQFTNTDDQMLCISQKLEKQFHRNSPLQQYDYILEGAMAVCVGQPDSFTHNFSPTTAFIPAASLHLQHH